MTVNEAILNILMVQFKNQLENNEVAIVKGANFRVEKNNGHFDVCTFRDGSYSCRYVYFREGYKDYQIVAWNGYTEKVYHFNSVADIRRFDFEAFLNAPINLEYYWVIQNRYNVYWGDNTETKRKMRRLKDAKAFIRYKREDIKKYKEQIAKIQADIESAIRTQVRYENDLAQLRKELGLVK